MTQGEVTGVKKVNDQKDLSFDVTDLKEEVKTSYGSSRTE